MENVIKSVHKWQHDAGNASQPLDSALEAAFQIEEALEGFTIPVIDGVTFKTHKEISRYIADKAAKATRKPLSEVESFDKAIDAFIFAIGHMAKLRLSPQEITAGIAAVNRANQQKLGMPRDERGKITKPENFVGPEVELQRILNGRTNV